MASTIVSRFCLEVLSHICVTMYCLNTEKTKMSLIHEYWYLLYDTNAALTVYPDTHLKLLKKNRTVTTVLFFSQAKISRSRWLNSNRYFKISFLKIQVHFHQVSDTHIRIRLIFFSRNFLQKMNADPYPPPCYTRQIAHVTRTKQNILYGTVDQVWHISWFLSPVLYTGNLHSLSLVG